MTNAKELPSSVVWQHWCEILDSMFVGGLDVVILRYKKPIAVMIPARDYEIIEELLDQVRKTRAIARSD